MNREETEKEQTPGGHPGNKFSSIFLVVALLLVSLPFITTFNEFLTSLFLRWELYRILQEMVVPYESKVVAGLYNLAGMSAEAVLRGVWVQARFIEVQWNCLGWQSVLLLIASYLTGFQGRYSRVSRFEVILIGFLGTYVINIFRLFFTGLLAIKIDDSVGIFFHDYLALILVIIWFVFFWWFSYSFVLEEREEA